MYSNKKMYINKENSGENSGMVSSGSVGSVALNGQLLSDILSDLNIKELLVLERVSKQFRDSVNYVLKRKTVLSVGPTDENRFCKDINHSIIGSNINESIDTNDKQLFDLIRSRQTFESILKKCPNIKSLFLSECLIDSTTIELIVRNCPQIECLALDMIYMSADLQLLDEMAKQISKLNLIHLSVHDMSDQEFVGNYRKISFDLLFNVLIQRLSSLQRLTLSDYDKRLTQLFQCLPQSIRSLHLIQCEELDLQSINALIGGNGRQLQELSINTYSSERNQMFETIAENLNLKTFAFDCEELLMNSFKTVLKLKNLKNLSINGVIKSKDEFKDIEFNRLESLRSVEFGQRFAIKPKILANFAKQFPKLRKLSLIDLEFECDCNESAAADSDDSCDQCIANCMQCFAQLPQLKHLSIECDFMDQRFNCQSLKLFTELDVFELNYYFDSVDNIVEILRDFCIYIIGNRVSKHSLTFVFRDEVCKRLIDEFRVNNILIPKYIRIKPLI